MTGGRAPCYLPPMRLTPSRADLSRPPAPRWVFPDPAAEDPVAVGRLQDELRLPAALCRLLVRRSHATPAAAKEFLRPHAGQIHAPETLAGIAEAVERLTRTIAKGETILVHGDYDVDGICATALYVRALREMGARAEAFVPHRLEDGYDLTAAGVAAAARCGARVILTGDCGIVAHGAVELARGQGIDVVVTDHHTPGETLPPAVAVVNPNRHDCGYAYKGLAGVGVAYKVCCALAAALGFPVERLTGYLDLVALATIADLAPLSGENRALVRWGLKVLPRTRNPGLAALLRSSGLAEKEEITAGQVGYILAPRLNAVGRMGEALRGVRLLLTDDEREADEIAAVLEEENRWRREVDAATLKQALDLLERDFDPARDRGVVLAREGWHPGVIGIVASRVVERIHRPTVLIALADGEGKGSARSVPGFHLYEAMRGCAEHLTRFGGHTMAAGCAIREERVESFRTAFQARAAAALREEQLTPELRIDVELTLPEADHGMYRMLRHAAPFGMGNPTPTLGVRGVRAEGAREVGSGHLKLTLAAAGASLPAIGFGMAERLPELRAAGGPLDVAFRLEENVWNGRTSLQARLMDLRPAG
jgi:single-stranded-DNA-specific exonuclease